MDNETILRQFEEIEQKVENLIGACQSLENANKELLDKNKRLADELRNKSKSETVYSQERDLIRSKIDGLLARLEGITEKQ